MISVRFQNLFWTIPNVCMIRVIDLRAYLGIPSVAICYLHEPSRTPHGLISVFTLSEYHQLRDNMELEFSKGIPTSRVSKADWPKEGF